MLGVIKDGQSNEVNRIIEIINVFFFAFFCFELVVKLLGEGFKYYLRDRYNWFDAGIVFISAIDISLVYILRNTTTKGINTTYLLI